MDVASCISSRVLGHHERACAYTVRAIAAPRGVELDFTTRGPLLGTTVLEGTVLILHDVCSRIPFGPGPTFGKASLSG